MVQQDDAPMDSSMD